MAPKVSCYHRSGPTKTRGKSCHFSLMHRHLWTGILSLFITVHSFSPKHQLKISIFTRWGLISQFSCLLFLKRGWRQTLLPGSWLTSKEAISTSGTSGLAGHEPTHAAQEGGLEGCRPPHAACTPTVPTQNWQHLPMKVPILQTHQHMQKNTLWH